MLYLQKYVVVLSLGETDKNYQPVKYGSNANDAGKISSNCGTSECGKDG